MPGLMGVMEKRIKLTVLCGRNKTVQLTLMQMEILEFIKDIIKSASRFGTYFEGLTGDLRSIITQVKNGEVKINVEHKGFEPVTQSLQRVVKLLIMALFSCSLIIGSCLVIVADIPPRWNETSVVGIAGLVLAAVIAGLLLKEMARKG